eukprot:CAMPEP_0171461088 /NCGR_PEP_ID=MMETSP0945-20130129/5684_1 /TAXON_ID=109269 /ORGANISM="Vaucheria litorea, Strain CCMP2940" /LENGTH=219 /DNA_ID=CAMNT_0011987381 /DNA_START=203 /DNA_END=862 /DNA_ORIENTATION=+
MSEKVETKSSPPKEASSEDYINAAKEVADQVKNSLSSISFETVQKDLAVAFEASKNNLNKGNIGERGELMTVLPFIGIFYLLIGEIPFASSFIEFTAGPGLMLTGAGFVFTSITALGKNLTPFPQPVEENELITDGVFSLSRHPIYTGIVLFGLGLGVTTNSFERIFMTGVILYLFDRKANEEEKMLGEMHSAYETYKEEVPKFFPLLDKIRFPSFGKE